MRTNYTIDFEFANISNRFLNSLIFNNEVDQYKPWVLFLIFISIFILIGGVVLLTHKKPESKVPKTATLSVPSSQRKTKPSTQAGGSGRQYDEEALHTREDGDAEDPVVWDLGEASDDEDGEEHAKKGGSGERRGSVGQRRGLAGSGHGEEGRTLMAQDGADDW